MTKPVPNPLPPLVQKFFVQYLINERQLSPCTVRSYRDSFRLLFAYCVFRRNRTPIPKESGQRSDNCRTEARGLPDTMTERSDAQGRQVAFSNSPVKLRSAVPSVGRAFRG